MASGRRVVFEASSCQNLRFGPQPLSQEVRRRAVCFLPGVRLHRTEFIVIEARVSRSSLRKTSIIYFATIIIEDSVINKRTRYIFIIIKYTSIAGEAGRRKFQNSIQLVERLCFSLFLSFFLSFFLSLFLSFFLSFLPSFFLSFFPPLFLSFRS